jgi:pantothenate kinase-related protein Tda10
VEGWMLGFKPFDSTSKEASKFFEKYPGMEFVNELLKEYEP